MLAAISTEKTIFLEAAEIASPVERAAYLERACGDDSSLRAAVEALLHADQRSQGLLDLTIERSFEEQPGTQIGPYKLMEQIGEGGMGLVYVAEQHEPVRRKVALKIIKPGMDTREVIARFEAERQALALMDHPNIAKVLDAGTTGEPGALATGAPVANAPGSPGRPYFVMELVRGLPITEYCDQHQLTTRMRLELFIQVCNAVQHAHQKGIIHRDIKPTNVLVTSHDGTPVVKVIDFGVAKAIGCQLTDKTVYTAFAQMIGTPLYMSPEQAGMSSLDVDTRSDIYSLGVLLYELLTGTTPFDKERLRKAEFDEVRRIIREEEPPKPSTRLSTLAVANLSTVSAQRQSHSRQLSQSFRGELDWIVMKALEKDRERRYETASAFAADVQRYLADEPVQACPPSTAYRLRKFARRNKTGLAATALVLFFVVLLGSGAGWAVRDRSHRLAVTTDQVEQALGQSEELYQQGKLPEATTAAEKARDLLESGGGSPEIRQRVRGWLADLEMVARLDEFRSQGVDLDWAESEKAYFSAFREYGIDVEALPPAEAASRIAARPISVDLAVTLDRLAWSLKLRAPAHPARWQRLLEITRAADPEPRRNQLRDIIVRTEKVSEALRQLAASADSAVMPPQTWLLLSFVLTKAEAGDSAGAIAALRTAQRQYPDDFRINLQLAGLLRNRAAAAEWNEAVGFNRAALALRPRSSSAHNELGAALLRRGDVDDALAEFRTAIRLKPDNALAHSNLGLSLGRKELWEEAVASYREAIRLKPDDASAHANLGRALKNKGLLDQALATCREAIRLKPDYYYAHYQLGNVLDQKGLTDEAIAAYREAIHLKPEYAEAHNDLGNVLSQKQLLVEAIAAYREAIRLKPDSALHHSNLGLALGEKGLWDEAIAAHREAIRLKPDSVRYRGLGDALRKKGLSDEAIAAYREGIRLKPDDATAHYWLGDLLCDKGLMDEAIAAYREAIRIRPEFAAPHKNLGFALAQKQAWDGAIAAYRESIRLEPDNAAVTYSNLANALRQRGDLDAAVAACQEAIRLRPDYAPAHHNLGTALVDKKQVDKAVAAYREAIRIRPEYALAHYCLGNALVEKQDWDGAIAAYREAVRLKVDGAMAHGALGIVHKRRGRLDEAIAAFREAIRLKPGEFQYHYNLGLALREKTDWDAAAAAFREAARLKPDLMLTHYHLGKALAAKGDRDAAIIAYRKASVLDPKNDEVRGALGVLLNNTAWHLATDPDPKRRDPARAVELAKEATGLMPNAHWNTLGVAHYNAGDYKAAVAALERSMKVREGGDSFDWFFLAMAHWRLDDKDDARTWYDMAVQWTDKNRPEDDELRRFRAEASELMGIGGAVEIAPLPKEVMSEARRSR